MNHNREYPAVHSKEWEQSDPIRDVTEHPNITQRKLGELTLQPRDEKDADTFDNSRSQFDPENPAHTTSRIHMQEIFGNILTTDEIELLPTLRPGQMSLLAHELQLLYSQEMRQGPKADEVIRKHMKIFELALQGNKTKAITELLPDGMSISFTLCRRIITTYVPARLGEHATETIDVVRSIIAITPEQERERLDELLVHELGGTALTATKGTRKRQQKKEPDSARIADIPLDAVFENDDAILPIEQATSDYRAMFHNHALLRAEEEVQLAQAIEAGLTAAHKLTTDEPLRGTASLTAADRLDLLLIKQAGEAAYDRMIMSNLRLVTSIARRHWHPERNMSVPDLTQEGIPGLVRAVQKFDYTKGYKFSTYATHWIKATIQASIKNQVRVIRLSTRVENKIHTIQKAVGELTAELSRYPTAREIADKTGMSHTEVRRLQALSSQNVESLDAQLDNEENGNAATLVDITPDIAIATPEERLLEQEQTTLLAAAISELSAREQLIVTLAFGLDGALPQTDQAIADTHGIPRSTIQKVRKNALTKLRLILHENDT